MPRRHDDDRTSRAPSGAPPILSRRIDVDRLPQHGGDFRVEATEDERAALADLNGLQGISRLVGEFVVEGGLRGARVRGHVEAQVTQTCVVTLEPIENRVREEIELEFRPARPAATPEEEELRRIDPPDEIIDNRIDLGALTAEYLALGLDPYPRKPDARFEPVESGPQQKSPFEALRKLSDEE